MSQVTEEQIVAALKSVIEPAKQKDIVSLEMISGLVVKDGNVGFAIEVDPAVGGKMEPLRKAAEKAVYNLPGVVSVTAVLTAEKSPEPRQQAAPRPAGGGTAAKPIGKKGSAMPPNSKCHPSLGASQF